LDGAHIPRARLGVVQAVVDRWRVPPVQTKGALDRVVHELDAVGLHLGHHRLGHVHRVLEQARWMMLGAPTITLASRNQALRPSLGQAVSCRFDEQRTQLTLLLCEGRNGQVLADVRAGAPLSVVFTHSPTTRSLPLKAPRAREVPLREGDRELVAAYVGSVSADWNQYGVPDTFVRTLLAREPGPLLALELSPRAAFDQTPGPHAGAPLLGRAP
jgi:hypothetical protein